MMTAVSIPEVEESVELCYAWRQRWPRPYGLAFRRMSAAS